MIHTRHALAAVLGLSLVFLAWTGVRYQSARSQYNSTNAQTQLTLAHLAEIDSLRTQSARAASVEPPQQDLFARAQQHLATVGLPSTHLERASIGASSESGSSQYRTIAAEISLRALSPSDLMRLLDHWRSTETVWTIVSLDLTAKPSRDRREPNYTTRVGLEAVYLAQGTMP